METAKPFSGALIGRPALVLLATSLGVLIAQVDSSVVNLAVKRIGAELGSTVSGMQWMIDAYNLAYAALLLTGGALGDLYGRKRIFVCGIVLFALGSMVCAAAPSTEALLAGRALTGVGAALLLPMSLVLLALAYPEARARQHALGIWASCNGLAFILGPTLGGLLVDTLGWRSIFYLILPLCAAALLLARGAVEESSSPKGRHLDLPGQAAAIAALGGSAFAAIEGAHLGWSSAPVLAAAALGALGAVAFFFVERRTTSGLVPLELFRRAPFTAALAIAGAMTFGIYAVLFLMPLYFQTVRGDSALMAGVHLLPMPAAYFLMSQWNGRVMHAFGPRTAMAAGMAAMGLGELGCAFFSADTSPWLIAASLTVAGIGLGLNTAPVNSVAVANAPRSRAGTASGLLNTGRMVGATFGVAILGALFAHLAGQAPTIESFTPGFRAALAAGAGAAFGGALVALAFIRRDSTQPMA